MYDNREQQSRWSLQQRSRTYLDLNKADLKIHSMLWNLCTFSVGYKYGFLTLEVSWGHSVRIFLFSRDSVPHYFIQGAEYVPRCHLWVMRFHYLFCLWLIVSVANQIKFLTGRRHIYYYLVIDVGIIFHGVLYSGHRTHISFSSK